MHRTAKPAAFWLTCQVGGRLPSVRAEGAGRVRPHNHQIETAYTTAHSTKAEPPVFIAVSGLALRYDKHDKDDSAVIDV